MKELISKTLYWKDRANLAEGDERVEFSMKADHYMRLVLRELPSLLCLDSQIKADIIIWDEDGIHQQPCSLL